jgi:hypothetical protein
VPAPCQLLQHFSNSCGWLTHAACTFPTGLYSRYPHRINLLHHAWGSLLIHLRRQHDQQRQGQGEVAAPGTWQQWHLLADQTLLEVRLEPSFEEAVGRCLALMASDKVEQQLLLDVREGAALSSIQGHGTMLAQVLVAGAPASSQLLLQHR